MAAKAIAWIKGHQEGENIMMTTQSLPLVFALVLLIVSFVWSVVTREISAQLFAVWAIAVLLIFTAFVGR